MFNATWEKRIWACTQCEQTVEGLDGPYLQNEVMIHLLEHLVEP